MTFWRPFILDDYPFTEFPAGTRVVDVGCGRGEQLGLLAGRGCHAIGVEPDADAVERCRRAGHDVRAGSAERIPLPDAVADAVVCKVVLPYCDERSAIRECARILVPGGTLLACYHGAGYYLRYLLRGTSLAERVYGLRSLLNSWWYSLTGARLAGWIGDTLYQSDRRMRRYYAEAGLSLEQETPAPRFMGKPVFMYHRVRKSRTPVPA